MAIAQTTAITAFQKPSPEMDSKIWVLGGRSSQADRSIGWDSSFPNFADPDILIINLNTLDEKTIQGIDRSKFQKAMIDINDKFMHSGALIIVITSAHANEKGNSSRI